MKKEDLVGAWRELGRDFVAGDGTVKPDIARTSQIMYTPDGYMGVVNTPAGRPKVGGTANPMNLDGLSAQERADAAAGVVAYTGRYEVDGDFGQAHDLFGAQSQSARHDAIAARDACRRRPHARHAARRQGRLFPHPLAAREQDVKRLRRPCP